MSRSVHKLEDNTSPATLKNKMTWCNVQKNIIVKNISPLYMCNTTPRPHCSRHHTQQMTASAGKSLQSKNLGITHRWDKHLQQVRRGRGWGKVTEKGCATILGHQEE